MRAGEREVRSSGPLRVLEVDCRSCGGGATLSDPSCRECVLGNLTEEVDGVVLLRPHHRLYPFLRPFLRELRSLRLLLSDRTRMGREGGRCRGCVEERERLLRASFSSFLRTLRPPELRVGGGRRECEECNSSLFLPLLREAGRRCRLLLSLREECLREVRRPFFADCFILPFRGKGEVVDSYPLRGGGRVRIHLREDSPLPFYELDLPEFRLPEELVGLLEEAFFSEPPEGSGEGWWREALLERGRGRYPAEELEELAGLVSRWTSYGILEALSRDEHLTDFLLPSPPELQPVRVIHERWDLCETGIRCSTPSLLHLAERLASRVGTSFDEVRPELDVEVEELGLRIFLARDPALWRGVGMAVRKRRERTWTQPLFLQRRTLTPLASSFLSWAVREGASAFIIGEVGSAKTSLLESLLPEVGREHHLICFQDTPELHVEELVRCGYSVENVRVGRPEELERQIEAFLRGGPAHWFIAEVRSQEAVRATLGGGRQEGEPARGQQLPRQEQEGDVRADLPHPGPSPRRVQARGPGGGNLPLQGEGGNGEEGGGALGGEEGVEGGARVLRALLLPEEGGPPPPLLPAGGGGEAAEEALLLQAGGGDDREGGQEPALPPPGGGWKRARSLPLPEEREGGGRGAGGDPLGGPGEGQAGGALGG